MPSACNDCRGARDSFSSPSVLWVSAPCQDLGTSPAGCPWLPMALQYQLHEQQPKEHPEPEAWGWGSHRIPLQGPGHPRIPNPQYSGPHSHTHHRGLWWGRGRLIVLLKLAVDVRHPVQDEPPVRGPHQSHGTHSAPHAGCGHPGGTERLSGSAGDLALRTFSHHTPC